MSCIHPDRFAFLLANTWCSRLVCGRLDPRMAWRNGSSDLCPDGQLKWQKQRKVICCEVTSSWKCRRNHWKSVIWATQVPSGRMLVFAACPQKLTYPFVNALAWRRFLLHSHTLLHSAFQIHHECARLWTMDRHGQFRCQPQMATTTGRSQRQNCKRWRRHTGLHCTHPLVPNHTTSLLEVAWTFIGLHSWLVQNFKMVNLTRSVHDFIPWGVLLWMLGCPSHVCGFNVDTGHPILFEGPKGSKFGFTVANFITRFGEKRWVQDFISFKPSLSKISLYYSRVKLLQVMIIWTLITCAAWV